jgi:hypothetical protein
MAKVPVNDPKHWRDRAEEARTVADEINEPDAKRKMLQIAKDYEELARRAEKQLRAAKNSKESWTNPLGTTFVQILTGKPTVTSKAEEYRRNAEECLDTAEVIRNASERAILLRIAHTWMQLVRTERRGRRGETGRLSLGHPRHSAHMEMQVSLGTSDAGCLRSVQAFRALVAADENVRRSGTSDEG